MEKKKGDIIQAQAGLQPAPAGASGTQGTPGAPGQVATKA